MNLSFHLTLEEATKKGDKFLIKVKNAKGKTYTYIVDRYGFGEKASLELKDNEVLFIDEMYKKVVEYALGKLTQPASDGGITTKISINQKDSDNIKPPC